MIFRPVIIWEPKVIIKIHSREVNAVNRLDYHFLDHGA